MIRFYVTYCVLIYCIFADILVDSMDFFNAPQNFFNSQLLEDSSTNYEDHMVSYSANSSVEESIHGLHLCTYGM